MNDFVPAPKVPFLVEKAEPSVIDGEVDSVTDLDSDGRPLDLGPFHTRCGHPRNRDD